MQKITKVCMIGLVCLIMTMFSCQTVDEVSPNESKTNTFKVEDITFFEGKMRFKDRSHFDFVFSELIKNNPSEKSNFEKISKLNNFESMNKLYQSISERDIKFVVENKTIPNHLQNIIRINEEDGEFEIERTVFGELLPSILNINGEFLIGNDLWMLGYENAFIQKGYIKNGKINKNTPKTVLKVTQERTTNDKKLKSAKLLADCNTEYTYNNNLYRVKGCLNVSGYGNSFHNVAIDVKHQRREVWIWWGNNVNYLELGWYANVWSNGGTTPEQKGYGSSGSSFALNIFPFPTTVKDINVSFFATCKDGNNRGCYLSR